MKTFLRVLVIVFGDLLTLPWQLGMLVAYCLTDWTEEEALENCNEWKEYLASVHRWMHTGRFDEED